MQNFNILSIPLKRLTEADKELNEQFFKDVATNLPGFIKDNGSHLLVNSSLALNNPNNLPFIHAFNAFMTLARYKHQLIQLTK